MYNDSHNSALGTRPAQHSCTCCSISEHQQPTQLHKVVNVHVRLTAYNEQFGLLGKYGQGKDSRTV